MQDYKNTILLKFEDEIDAVIFTNEEPEVIQRAITRAYSKWKKLGTYPESQLDYTLQYLSDIYDINYVDMLAARVTEIYY